MLSLFYHLLKLVLVFAFVLNLDLIQILMLLKYHYKFVLLNVIKWNEMKIKKNKIHRIIYLPSWGSLLGNATDIILKRFCLFIVKSLMTTSCQWGTLEAGSSSLDTTGRLVVVVVEMQLHGNICWRSHTSSKFVSFLACHSELLKMLSERYPGR